MKGITIDDIIKTKELLGEPLPASQFIVIENPSLPNGTMVVSSDVYKAFNDNAKLYDDTEPLKASWRPKQ